MRTIKIASITSKGFTLIELLIVIAMIGILSSFVNANMSEGRAQSRDAERYSDLKQIQVALELYKSKYGEYPEHNSDTYIAAIEDELVPEFMPTLLRDPLNREEYWDYRYVVSDDGYYSLLARNDAGTSWCSITSHPDALWVDPDNYPACPW